MGLGGMAGFPSERSRLSQPRRKAHPSQQLLYTVTTHGEWLSTTLCGHPKRPDEGRNDCEFSGFPDFSEFCRSSEPRTAYFTLSWIYLSVFCSPGLSLCVVATTLRGRARTLNLYLRVRVTRSSPPTSTSRPRPRRPRGRRRCCSRVGASESCPSSPRPA